MLSNTFCHWCQWDELGTVAFSCRGMDTAVSSWSPTTGPMTSLLLCSALGTEHSWPHPYSGACGAVVLHSCFDPFQTLADIFPEVIILEEVLGKALFVIIFPKFPNFFSGPLAFLLPLFEVISCLMFRVDLA